MIDNFWLCFQARLLALLVRSMSSICSESMHKTQFQRSACSCLHSVFSLAHVILKLFLFLTVNVHFCIFVHAVNNIKSYSVELTHDRLRKRVSWHSIESCGCTVNTTRRISCRRVHILRWILPRRVSRKISRFCETLWWTRVQLSSPDIEPCLPFATATHPRQHLHWLKVSFLTWLLQCSSVLRLNSLQKVY